MDVACSTALHRHPVACEGCGTTTGVEIQRIRGGGSYSICDTCYSDRRPLMFRAETKAERIAAVARSTAAQA